MPLMTTGAAVPAMNARRREVPPELVPAASCACGWTATAPSLERAAALASTHQAMHAYQARRAARVALQHPRRAA